LALMLMIVRAMKKILRIAGSQAARAMRDRRE
jgi:hypothetical protein